MMLPRIAEDPVGGEPSGQGGGAGQCAGAAGGWAGQGSGTAAGSAGGSAGTGHHDTAFMPTTPPMIIAMNRNFSGVADSSPVTIEYVTASTAPMATQMA